MPFVTRLTLQSGDGELLDSIVTDIKKRAERKGVELKGPHPEPPSRHAVPQYKDLSAQDAFENWEYTVYTRNIEIIDHNEFARSVAGREYSDRIYLTADVEQYSQTGE
jgi:ribosomal protein S10